MKVETIYCWDSICFTHTTRPYPEYLGPGRTGLCQPHVWLKEKGAINQPRALNSNPTSLKPNENLSLNPSKLTSAKLAEDDDDEG